MSRNRAPASVKGTAVSSSKKDKESRPKATDKKAVAKVARKSKKYSDGSSRAGALAHARYELRKEADDLQKAVSMLSGVKSKKKSKRKLTAHLKDLHQG